MTLNDSFKVGDQVYYDTRDEYENTLEVEGWVHSVIDETEEDPACFIKVRGERFKLVPKKFSDLTKLDCDYWEPFEEKSSF
jgi:hypothetical protein